MSQSETVYDSTVLQLEALNSVAAESLTMKELAKPESVRLLLDRHKVTLTELKSKENESSKLKVEVDRLKEEISDLKVNLARSDEGKSKLFLEIPVGALSGFAINILTAKPSDGTGWVLFILSLIMLLFIRLPRQKTPLNTNKNEESNAK